MSQFDLNGIDGSNPIGFLAAVGNPAGVGCVMRPITSQP